MRRTRPSRRCSPLPVHLRPEDSHRRSCADVRADRLRAEIRDQSLDVAGERAGRRARRAAVDGTASHADATTWGAIAHLVPQAADAPGHGLHRQRRAGAQEVALLARFRHPERQVEEPHFQAWFEQNGYKVVKPAARLNFEGEGDALFAGDTLLAGYLKRSDIRAHRWLSETLGAAGPLAGTGGRPLVSSRHLPVPARLPTRSSSIRARSTSTPAASSPTTSRPSK